MTLTGLAWRSLRVRWRLHLGVGLGVVIATAVLVGSLIVGDSINASLQSLAKQRTGAVGLALNSHERMIRDALAPAISGDLQTPVAPVLQLDAVAARPTEEHSYPGVRLLGVDDRFWQLDARPGVPVAPESVVLSAALARALHAQVGETLVFRVEKPSPLPREAPLSTDADAHVGLRLTVSAIAPENSLGRFSLRSESHEALNAFVPLSWLQEAVGVSGKVNLLLVREDPGVSPERAQRALRRHIELDDLSLELRDLPNGVELRSDRLFLEPPVVSISRHALEHENEIFTYFVNELRHGDRAVPYSTVAGLETSHLPGFDRLGAGEVLINTWLAEELHAHRGDWLDMKYYAFGSGRTLEERAVRLRIAGVVPMTGEAADPSLMPEVPGLTDIANCRDWSPGFPLDHARIRPQDEAYWQQFRGTPKAFVHVSLAEKLWGSRYGDRTAIRYASLESDQVSETFRNDLEPAALGLNFLPVASQVRAASDFGPLFLGFSFFLIAGALLLTTLLFIFGLEARAEELQAMQAMGFPARRIRLFLLLEAGGIVVLGVLVGSLLGQLYTRGVLAGLATIWRDAVGLTSLRYAARPFTVLIGAVASAIVAFGALLLSVQWKLFPPKAKKPLGRDGTRRRQWGSVLGLVAVGLVAISAGGRDLISAALFFLAGSLLLIAGIVLSDGWLASWRPTLTPTLFDLARRNLARQRVRSVATIALLASGTFVIVAVGANRQDPKRVWGAGRVELYAESTLPVLHDLGTPAGRAALGLDESLFRGVHVYSLRLHEGDDASCLTPSQAVRPRILGVKPGDLMRAGFIAPEKWIEPSPTDVSTLGDNGTVVWSLHSREDGIIEYPDERGDQMRLHIRRVLPDSIFQGGLLIPEEAFVEHFPSETGYHVFLVDAPPEKVEAVSNALSTALRDSGLKTTLAWKRLATFHAVENTYLAIFQLLGALGFLLGCVGVGVLVLRQVLERREELAVLSAVGFTRRRVRWLVTMEHLLLLGLGLGTGIIAAFVAVTPALRSPGADVPVLLLVATLAVIVLGAVAAVLLATRIAFRGSLVEALQRE